jgi:hypothetical protein
MRSSILDNSFQAMLRLPQMPESVTHVLGRSVTYVPGRTFAAGNSTPAARKKANLRGCRLDRIEPNQSAPAPGAQKVLSNVKATSTLIASQPQVAHIPINNSDTGKTSMKPVNTARSISSFLLMGAATLLIAACASQEQPALQAITAVDTTLHATAEDARKYVPEQYNEALKKLNAMKVEFDRSDYKAVIAGGPAALAAAQGLTAAAAAGKAEAMKVAASDWSSISVSLPAFISTVESRGVALEKAKKLPEGVDLPTARRSIADAQHMWAKAQEAASAGQTDTAVDTAKMAKRRSEQAAKALKMTLPPG